MTDYTEQAAIGVGEEARSEVEPDEEPGEVPSLLKDLDDVDLHEYDTDDVDELLKQEFATDIEEVQGTVLTEEHQAEAPEESDSYTDLIALAEHDPDTVDPDEIALEHLWKDAQEGELDGTTTVDDRGDTIRNAIERATADVRSHDTTDEALLFREAVAHATDMASTKIEAAELAGDYVLKVSNDTKTAVQARREAMEGYGKARQYVSDPSEAPDDVNCKEGPNGSLYYDPEERGRGNNEATGPVDNDLLDMDRDELKEAMEVDPNDPDSSLADAQQRADAKKAVRKVAEAFDVEVGRVARFFKDARERGVTDAQSLVKHAEVVFGKVEDPDSIEDPDDDGEEELDIEGDPDEIEDPDDDGEEEVDFAPFLDNPDEKEEDPCWDGYVQVGMKEGEDGEQVPNCVPEEEAKAVDEETLKGRRYVSDPEDAPDDVDVQEGQRGGYYYDTEDLPGDEDAEDVDDGGDDEGDGDTPEVSDEDVGDAMEIAVDMIRQPESYDHVDPDGREDMAEHAAEVVAGDDPEEAEAVKDEVIDQMVEEEIGVDGLQMVIDETNRGTDVQEAIEGEAEFLADTYGYPQDAVEEYLEDEAADYDRLDYGDEDGADGETDGETNGEGGSESGGDVPEAVEEQGWGAEWEEYEDEPQARADLVVDSLEETGEMEQLWEEAVVDEDTPAEDLVEPLLDYNGVPEGEARDYAADQLVTMVEQEREFVDNNPPRPDPEQYSTAEDVIDEGVKRAFDGGGSGNVNRGKARRYVSDPEEVPDQYEVQEGPHGGYYYETGEGESHEEATGQDDEGMTDEELQDQTVDAMHDIAEIDGAVNISGEEREDGYGITMDVAEDADPSEVATQVASVDGTANITGEENEDGSLSISMDVMEPVDDEDNPVDGNEEAGSPRETGTQPYDLTEYGENESPYSEGEDLPESVTDSYVGEDIDTDIPSVDTMSNMNGRQLADMADYFNADVSDEDIQEAMSLDGDLDSEDIATQIASTAELDEEPVEVPPEEARGIAQDVEDEAVDPDEIGERVFEQVDPATMDEDEMWDMYAEEYVEEMRSYIEDEYGEGSYEMVEDAVDELAGERADMYAPDFGSFEPDPEPGEFSALDVAIDSAFEKRDPNWPPEQVFSGNVSKGRRYISDPDEAPEDAEVQEGPQGGLYYEIGGEEGGESEEEDAEEEDEPTDLSDMSQSEQADTIREELDIEADEFEWSVAEPAANDAVSAGHAFDEAYADARQAVQMSVQRSDEVENADFDAVDEVANEIAEEVAEQAADLYEEKAISEGVEAAFSKGDD